MTKMNSISEGTLIRRLRDGDGEAKGELLLLLYPRAVILGEALVSGRRFPKPFKQGIPGLPSGARPPAGLSGEDVAHLGLLKTLKAVAEGAEVRANLEAFMTKVIDQAYINMVSKSIRQGMSSLDAPAYAAGNNEPDAPPRSDFVAGPEDLYASFELEAGRARIFEALYSLTNVPRQAALLAFIVCGFEHGTTAQLLGRAKGTIKADINRSKAEILKKLGLVEQDLARYIAYIDGVRRLDPADLDCVSRANAVGRDILEAVACRRLTLAAAAKEARVGVETAATAAGEALLDVVRSKRVRGGGTSPDKAWKRLLVGR